MNIFADNLGGITTEKHLKALFSRLGEVRSFSLAMDQCSSRSRGFAIVDMPKATNAAIKVLHNTSLNNQSRVVNDAKSRSAGKGI